MRNRTRAVRRIAERTARNALALEAAAEVEEARPKLKNARHKTQLEFLANRNAISQSHRRAGELLAADYRRSETLPATLIGRYEANMPRAPKRYQFATDTPGAIDARARFEAALAAVGPWLSDVLIHVAVCDMPVAQWGPMNGRAATHGLGVLYTALDALVAHYGERRRAA